MKNTKIISIVLTILVALMIIPSGLMKAIHLPWSVDGLVKFNIPHSATVLGIMEMSFAILFIIPTTMRIGFILLCCYFAGAMATELSHDGQILNPAIPLILIWITAFVRDRTIFLGPAKS